MTNIRPATFEDIETIKALIHNSVMELQASEYTLAQREGALGTVFGIDTNLIKDGTYLIVEENGQVQGVGGWSFRKAMYGADTLTQKEPETLDPKIDAARIRAFFIDPKHARKGLGAKILEACENAARAAGFTCFELGSTLTGVPFYKKYGYRQVRLEFAPLPNGELLEILVMSKP